MKVKLKVEWIQNVPRTVQSYWKLNNSILNDEDFLPSFKHLWSDLQKRKDKYAKISDWWDIVAKPEIKEFCIMFSKHRRLTRNETYKFLLSYLKIVLADNNWEEIVRVKEKLHSMVIQDSLGIVIRSRNQQNAEEERGSIYHAVREAKNGKNNIHTIKVDGTVVRDSEQIEKVVTSFFTALLNGHHNNKLENTGTPFIPDYTHLNKYLRDLGSLDNEESSRLHSSIKIEELEYVLKGCKNNKSPGLDGLTYEFYKKV